MIPKYHVEYSVGFRKQDPVSDYRTDDPVACTEFITELIERGLSLRDIKHDGVSLPRGEFDKLVKTSAGIVTARHLCRSLGIKPEEEHFRFGFAA